MDRKATMTPTEIVNSRVAKFAALEDALDKAYEAALALDSTEIDEGQKMNLVGALEAGLVRGKVRELAGVIGHAQRLKFELHRHETDVAQKHGIDVPQTRDGSR